MNNSDYDDFKALLSSDMRNTIQSILTETPDENKTETALRAILFGPLPEYDEFIKNNLENNAAFYNEHEALRQLAENALSLLEEEIAFQNQNNEANRAA